jgi:hypothetical protein
MRYGPTVTYYDAMLAGIGGSLIAGVAVGVLGPTRPRVGLLLGSLVATAFVYLGAFYNPPVESSATRAQVAAIAWHLYLVVLLAFTL